MNKDEKIKLICEMATNILAHKENVITEEKAVRQAINIVTLVCLQIEEFEKQA